MIPLRSDVKTRNWPVMTWIIILINFYIFYGELRLGGSSPSLERFVLHWGVVPNKLIGHFLSYGYTLVTATFLHGGWIHILSNMLFLWIFGKSVEDAMGHFRYIYFYLITGIIANGAQAYLSPATALPLIGASGAIAGVLGAYFFYYPHSRILTIVPIFFFMTIREVPAFLFLGLWFVIQALSGTMSFHLPIAQAAGGIAWWAHTIGFVAGLVLSPAFGRPRR